MTSVSTKYTPCLGCILDACKVFVVPDVGDRGQHLGQVAPSRATQHTCQDFPMLGLGAAAMICRALLERPNNGFIDITYDQSRHSACTP
jgi:hypothetical protein